MPARIGRDRDGLRDFGSDDDRDIGSSCVVGCHRIERAIADGDDDGRARRGRDRHTCLRGERHRAPRDDVMVGVECGHDGAARPMLGRQLPARVARIDHGDLAGIRDQRDRARRQRDVDRIELAEHDALGQIERVRARGTAGDRERNDDNGPHFHCTFASTCGPLGTA